MNAREAMLALLDGKTVEFSIGKLKLDENGTILAMWHHDECHDTEWHEADMLMNNPDFKIVEEYPLTFKEAMQEAINGKKIVCNRRPVYMYSFNPAGKLIEITPCGSDIASISDVLINAKWNVVE